jgi:hypothetical protein
VSDALDAVLARLDSPREVAPGRWRARCPAHDGKSRSTLSLTRGDDDRVLLHCFGGCEVEQVVATLGLQLADLMPPAPTTHRAGPMRAPFVPAQVFGAVRHEVGVVSVIASDMHRSRAVSDDDYVRLKVAADRLDEAATHAYGRKC